MFNPRIDHTHVYIFIPVDLFLHLPFSVPIRDHSPSLILFAMKMVKHLFGMFFSTYPSTFLKSVIVIANSQAHCTIISHTVTSNSRQSQSLDESRDFEME